MKKKLLFMLATVLTVCLCITTVSFGADDSAKLSEWTKVVDGASSVTVTENSDLHAAGEAQKSVRVAVSKNGDAFGGVKSDISQAMQKAANDYNAVVGVKVSFYNAVALNGDVFVLKFKYGDKEWNVAATQTAEGAMPSLDNVGEKSVTALFSSVTEELSPADVEEIVIGVQGKNSAELYLQQVNLLYSDEQISPAERELVSTVNTIGSIAFGAFQYGGTDGATTAQKVENDNEKSKEKDGTSLNVSVNGTQTADRIFSVYFPLAAQKSALTLQNPKGISFWVYNNVKGGGLLFKAGAEITDGIKVFDANDIELTDKINNRDLDYEGFRRYEISLDNEKLAASELEIGVWGASESTSYNLSAFSFVDMVVPSVGNKSMPSVSSMTFNNFSTTEAMQKIAGNSENYSKEESGAYVGIVRNDTTNFDISSLYLTDFSQNLSSANVVSPKYISFDVYNKVVVENGGLLFKFDSDEEVNVSWEAADGTKGTGRDLDYVGFRRYTVALSDSRIVANEMQLGIWGTSAAEVYFSSFAVYDASSVKVEVGEEQSLIAMDASSFVVCNASFDARLCIKDGFVNFTVTRNGADGTAYIQHSLTSLNGDNVLSVTLVADRAYGKDMCAVDILYDDGTEVLASYRVANFAFENARETVVLELNKLAYFLGAADVKALRLSQVGKVEQMSFSVEEIKSSKQDETNKKVYRYTVSDFETVEDAAKWKVSYASGTTAVIGFEKTNVKVGKGALSYRFANALYDFGWTETYLDVADIIAKNTDNNIKGISFWLYNENYVMPGDLGFWLKVAQNDGTEYEVKYSSVISEKDTNNSLGFSGWQKINIPFSAADFTEQNYNSGYNPSSPRQFDWKQLAYIKIGYWGTYYDSDKDLSCQTTIDDVKFVSENELTVKAPEYHINYNVNGGVLPNDAKTTYVCGEKFTLPIPQRDGYEFVGWYTNSELSGENVTEISESDSADKTFYAAWEKKKGCFSVVDAASIASLVLAVGAALVFVRKKK